MLVVATVGNTTCIELGLFVFLTQGGQGKQACSVADRLGDIFAKRIDSVNDTRESQLCVIHSARRL
jgi:hypothetical protein